MIVAQCVFENSTGLSNPYSYGITPELLKELKEGDHVVVSGSRTAYNVAIFVGTKVLTTEEEVAIVTQHVCCKVVDGYGTIKGGGER